MRLVFPEFVNHRFINRAIKPTLIMFYRDMNNKGKFNKMNEILYDILGSKITAIDILTYAINNAYVGKYRNNWIIDVSSKTLYKNTNQSISSLVNLIEFGNLEVKGTNAIVLSYNYIRKNLNLLFHIYGG